MFIILFYANPRSVCIFLKIANIYCTFVNILEMIGGILGIIFFIEIPLISKI